MSEISQSFKFHRIFFSISESLHFSRQYEEYCHVPKWLPIHLIIFSAIDIFEFLVYQWDIVVITKNMEEIGEILCLIQTPHIDEKLYYENQFIWRNRKLLLKNKIFTITKPNTHHLVEFRPITLLSTSGKQFEQITRRLLQHEISQKISN